MGVTVCGLNHWDSHLLYPVFFLYEFNYSGHHLKGNIRGISAMIDACVNRNLLLLLYIYYAIILLAMNSMCFFKFLVFFVLPFELSVLLLMMYAHTWGYHISKNTMFI